MQATHKPLFLRGDKKSCSFTNNLEHLSEKYMIIINRQFFIMNENVQTLMTLIFFITLFNLRENTITGMWIDHGNQFFENTEKFSSKGVLRWLIVSIEGFFMENVLDRQVLK